MGLAVVFSCDTEERRLYPPFERSIYHISRANWNTSEMLSCRIKFCLVVSKIAEMADCTPIFIDMHLVTFCVSFEDFPAAILALLSADVDGVVIDTVSATGFMDEYPDQMKINSALKSDEQLGFVFPPGSELTASVDAALESMIADGSLEEFNIKWKLAVP